MSLIKGWGWTSQISLFSTLFQNKVSIMGHCWSCSWQSNRKKQGNLLTNSSCMGPFAKNQPVKQKIPGHRLEDTGLSDQPMPWDGLLFKEGGNFSQIWGSPWGLQKLHQCAKEEPSFCDITLHPATWDPFRHPNFLNSLKMVKLWSWLSAASAGGGAVFCGYFNSQQVCQYKAQHKKGMMRLWSIFLVSVEISGT